ncbi:hypothetical protein ACVOMV_21810 [Mesorhizobium atlanticum]
MPGPGDDSAPEAARKVLREFEKNGQSVDAALVSWSPETLRKILAEDLPDAQVIVVSNREPYIHNETQDGGVELVVPASGLSLCAGADHTRLRRHLDRLWRRHRRPDGGRQERPRASAALAIPPTRCAGFG